MLYDSLDSVQQEVLDVDDTPAKVWTHVDGDVA